MINTPNLGLKVWNLTTDPYDSGQLADNWARVDEHDHASGRGKQIPTGGIEDGAVTAAKLAVGANVPPDASITDAKLAANSVTTAKLANSAVDSAQLASGSVTSAKLAAPTTGTATFDATSNVTISSGTLTARKLTTGLVVLEGSLTASTTPIAGTNRWAKLPVGFRPSVEKRFVIVNSTIAIEAGGDIRVLAASSANAYFDNVAFYV